MASRVIPVETFDLVIFGGTGDLARRKILPGLFRRFRAGQMPEGARIIGAARSDLDQGAYQEMVRDAIAEFGGAEKDDKASLAKFLETFAHRQTYEIAGVRDYRCVQRSWSFDF